MASWADGISDAWKNDIGFLQLVSELSGLSAAIWMTGRTPKEACWSTLGEAHPCLTDDALRKALEESCGGGSAGLYFDTDCIFYGVLPVGPFSLALGPAATGAATAALLQNYAEDYGLDAQIKIQTRDLRTVSKLLNLLHCHFIGTPMSGEPLRFHFDTDEQWQIESELASYQLEQHEQERNFQAGVEYENTLLQAVEHGDVDGLKALLSGPMPDTEQISGYSFSHSREMEYMMVSSITLMTRAAIAGGVPLELAHQLGTVYMNRLAKAVDQGAGFVSLGYNAMLEYTELVRRCREEKSAVSYVDACKQYIEDNFRKQLQVGEIAPAIGLSRTYLSRLFHEAEGITVQQYIQKVRCRHAAQMLQYSDYSIAQIALYNGFSSQSYFGACFQSWYGMTPNAYRKAKH